MKRVRLGDRASRAGDQIPSRGTSKSCPPDSAQVSLKSDRLAEGPQATHRTHGRRDKGRFPKGVSGNRAGRPIGSKNKRTVIIEMMEAKLGRKIPDPKKLTRYEGMMFKAIQKALSGDIRSMTFVLTEYRNAESSVPAIGAATSEEDQQAYDAFREKIRREIEEEVRVAVRAEMSREANHLNGE
jgi:hypothetical protein